VFIGILSTVYSVSQAESVSFWTQYADEKALYEVLDSFTKESGIEVELKPINWETDPIFIAYAGGVLPDLFTHGAAALGLFGTKDFLMPLDSTMASWPFVKDMVPAIRKSGEYNGRQVVIPWNGITVRDLIYTENVLAEVGINSRSLPQGWENFAQVARKLVKRDADGRMKRSALALPKSGNAAQQWWFLFLNQAGGEILTNGKPQLGSGPAIDAMQYYTDLIYTYNLDDLNFSGTLTKGTSAMTWTSWGSIKPLIDKGMDIGIATFPYKVRPASFLAPDWAAIPKSAHNPKGAARLLEYLLQPEQQKKLNQSFGGAVPFYRSAQQWDWVKSSPQLRHLFNAAEYAMPNPTHPLWFEIRDELVKDITSALKRETPPETAMRQAQDTIMRLVTPEATK
jgi:ABC-type glycerol-3-phosphate transport system substrate-binding protein